MELFDSEQKSLVSYCEQCDELRACHTIFTMGKLHTWCAPCVRGWRKEHGFVSEKEKRL